MGLFQDIYMDLLLEGKTPEQIMGILKYKYNYVPEGIIDSIFNIDPTNKKSYTAWVLSHFKESKNDIIKSIKDGTLKTLFDYVKSHNDVQLQSFDSFDKAIGLITEEDTVLAKTGDENADDFDIIYDEPNWLIAVPHTYEADRKLGENCRWCTAGAFGDGRPYWNRYSRQGNLFVNFDKTRGEHLYNDHFDVGPKDYPYKRYQLCFEANEFMDSHDNRIDPDEMNMPEEVTEFYREKGYDIDKLTMSQEEKYERYYDARMSDDNCRYLWDGCEILREFNHDYEWEGDGSDEDYDYYVYNTEYDDNDPICWEAVKTNPVFINEDDEIAILKERSSERYMILVSSDRYNIDYETGILEYKVIEANGHYKIAFTEDYRNETKIGIARSGGISSVKVNGHVGNLITKYIYNELCVEVTLENGLHRLYTETYNNELETLVSGDIPVNGDDFTVDENGVIEGKFGQHKILVDPNTHELYVNDDEDGTFDIDEKCENENYYIVNTPNGYNIINIEAKQKIITKDFQKYHDCTDLGFIIANYEALKENKSVIYDLNGKQLTDFYNDVKLISTSPFMGVCGVMCGQTTTYSFYNTEFKKLGTFGKPLGIIGNNKLLARTLDGVVRTINLLDGTIGLEWVENYGPLHIYGHPEIIAVSDDEHNTFIINADTEQILVRDIDCSVTPTQLEKDEPILRVKHSNGYNYVNLTTFKELLPMNVEECEKNSNQSYYDWGYLYSPKSFVGCKNGNRVYFVNITNGKILPSQEGFLLPEGVTAESSRSAPVITFILPSGAKFQCNYNTGKYEMYTQSSNNPKEDEMLAQQIMSPNLAQVQQSFNEIFNRINKFGRESMED